MSKRDLVLVMPVYNEEACLPDVLDEWRGALDALAIDYRVLVFNDGSKDRTGAVLDDWIEERGASERFEAVHNANRGHGPTILDGYRRGVEEAHWVFQCDSDDEMSAVHFARFWRARQGRDAIFGMRHGRIQNRGRAFMSMGSRILIGTLMGRGARDVNVPYRLMRSRALAPILTHIPPDTFAPNILIAGALGRRRGRVINLRVPHHERATGVVSIDPAKLARLALRCAGQTLRVWPRLRVLPPY